VKAVVFAAGKGVRMQPLSLKTPKPLLPVNGKPIIDYIFEALTEIIDEVIVAIREKGELIKKHLGKEHFGKKVRYVVESEKGTPTSYLAATKYLDNERFLLIYGDEIPNMNDINNCLQKELSILVFRPSNPSSCGMAYFRKDGSIKRILEKPKTSTSKLAANGVMVLHTDVFTYTPTLVHGEYFFSSMVSQFIRDHKVFPVKSVGFIGGVTTPDDLLRIGKILQKREKHND
jgi:NDP-sugar pyrophosphorylase family protein